MKIIHVITRLIVGGAQENTLLSCEGQHRAGHEVTLITGPETGPEGSLMARAQSAGYKVELLDEMRRAVRPLKDYAAYRVLIRRFRESKPDIVHTHSSKAGILARHAAHRAGVPGVIHTIHGLAFTASTSPLVNAVYKFAERRAAPVSDKIVCVATAMASQSLAAGIGRPDQYVTVYSGMDTAPFLDAPRRREEVRRELGIADDDIIAGTIARLFYLKGHDDLLAIAPRLCAQFPKLKFLWIGDGILKDRFESRMRAMNLRDRFILTGLVAPTKIPELTGAMDILVHPSRREGLARAIPQGQLARCPVVTYDIDGNREGLIEGQTGYAVRPFDVARLEAHLSDLLADPDRRRAMGEKGRAFAVSRFDTQVMIDALERVYQEVLGAKRPPAAARNA